MSSSVNQRSSLVSSSTISQMMDPSTYHHHSYSHQDLHQVNLNSNSSLEPNNVPAHHYYSSQYLSVNNSHNYNYPYNQTANQNQLNADYYPLQIEYPTTNSYSSTQLINSHDNNNNNNQSSSTLNTPTLDPTISSYYPAFQQPAAVTTPTTCIYQPDYYYQSVATNSVQTNTGSGGSLYSQTGGGSLNLHEQAFSAPNQYNNSGNYQHLPVNEHPTNGAGGRSLSALDRAQIKAPNQTSICANTNNQQSRSAQVETRCNANNLQSAQTPIELSSSSASSSSSVSCINQQQLQPLQLKLNETGNQHRSTGSSSRQSTPAAANATSAGTASLAAHTNHRPHRLCGANDLVPLQTPASDKQAGSGGAASAAESSGCGGDLMLIKCNETTSSNNQSQMFSKQQRGAVVAKLRVGPLGIISRRKNATRETTQTLKKWLDDHEHNPYPSKGEKIMLSIITKMSLTQVSTWFANARRRMKKENRFSWATGKVGAGGGGGGGGGNNQLMAGGGFSRSQNGGNGGGGTASIRNFINKHQKELANSRSVLALAAGQHLHNGGPFIFCPHSNDYRQHHSSGSKSPSKHHLKVRERATSGLSTSADCASTSGSATAAASTTNQLLLLDEQQRVKSDSPNSSAVDSGSSPSSPDSLLQTICEPQISTSTISNIATKQQQQQQQQNNYETDF